MRKMFCAALVAAFVPPIVAHAQSPKPIQVSVSCMVDAFGTVSKKTDRAGFVPVQLPLRRLTMLFGRDTVRTGRDSAALITFGENGYLRIGANSLVAISDNGVSLSFKVLVGQAWASSPKQNIRLSTPSAVITTTGAATVGVGYDAATDLSVASVGSGAATISLPEGNWRGVAQGGDFVQYLRDPKPNIRLRSPVIAPHPPAHEAMWRQLRAEPWTQGKPGKLTRGIEADLQVLVPATAPKGGKR